MVITKNQPPTGCHDASENHPKGEIARILDWSFHDFLLSNNILSYKFWRSEEEHISITVRRSKPFTTRQSYL